MTPRPSQVFRDPVVLLAFGGGAGLMPHGPGTWGSLLALPLAAWLLQHDPWVYAGACVLIALVGIPICGLAAKRLGVHDHGGIVWDEISGQLICCAVLYWLPTNITLAAGLGLCCVAFRIFDIAKPWPIGAVDRQVHGGLGIMLDDWLAAVMAAAVSLLCLQWIG